MDGRRCLAARCKKISVSRRKDNVSSQRRGRDRNDERVAEGRSLLCRCQSVELELCEVMADARIYASHHHFTFVRDHPFLLSGVCLLMQRNAARRHVKNVKASLVVFMCYKYNLSRVLANIYNLLVLLSPLSRITSIQQPTPATPTISPSPLLLEAI